MESNSGNGQKLKVAEFQGYTMAKLEGIEMEIRDMKESVKELSRCVQSNKGKIIGLASTISLVVTIIILIIKTLILG